MAVSNDDVLRCSARWSSPGGDDVVNVFWFKADLTADQTDIIVFQAVDSYISSVYADFDHLIRSTYSPVDLKVDVVEFISGKWETTHNVGYGPWGATVTPSASSDALPPGTSVLARMQTGLGKHEGRKYFFGFDEGQNDTGGNPSSTLVAAVLSGISQLLSDWNFNTTEYLTTVVADHTTGVTRQILSAVVNTVFSYQRRRRYGAGS